MLKRNTLFRCFCYLALLFLTTFVSIAHLQAQVVINEFSAANYGEDQDNYGSYEDWIELYNTSASSVDLTGYHLSDRSTNPTKWQFPAGITIAPNDFLLIWASDRDQFDGTNIHTNFAITQTKDNESIVFADPDGNILDEHPLSIPNKTDHSTARVSDGAAQWGVSTNPTPGFSNINLIAGYALTPQISPPAGRYEGNVTLNILSVDASLTIYYTLDGSEPDNGSTEYAGPVSIGNTSVVRAIAYSSDSEIQPSFIETNTYFIDEIHTVPVVSICGDVEDMLDGGWGSAGQEPEGHFELFDADFNQLDEAEGEYNKHGNDSWAYDQRGFDYITRDQFGYNYAIQNQIFPTKTRDEYQRLILKAAANDNYPFEDGAYIRDAYLHTLSDRGNMELDERTSRPCVLYVNGKYWGVYELREKVDDHDYTKYYYNQDKQWLDFIKTWGNTWEEYGSMDDWEDLYDFITSNDMSDDANYAMVKEELNVLSLIDYIILNTHAVCSDWLNYNTGWWRGRNPAGEAKKWRYILWDLDASFGHYINYTGIPDTGADADPCDNEAPGIDDPEGHIDLLTALYDNEEFFNLYINRYADLNNTIFSCEYMEGLLDEMIGEIAPEMGRQVARWGGTASEWLGNVEELRAFIQTRCTTIDNGIEDCYDVGESYDITIIIEGEGAVSLSMLGDIGSGITITDTWTGSYFGNIEVPITATPDNGYEFSHFQWVDANGAVLPNNFTPTGTFDLDGNDTLIVYFNLPSYLITFLVEPEGMGDIDLNGFVSPFYPWGLAFTEGTSINMSAIAPEGYVFAGWTSNNHSFDPDASTESTSMTVNSIDTVVALFTEALIPITVLLDPPEMGTVLLNGNEITMDTWTGEYVSGTSLLLEALPNSDYLFVGWQTEDGTLLSPEVILDYTLNEETTLTAVFALKEFDITIVFPAENQGTVTIDGETIDGTTTYTYTIGSMLNLTAEALEGFDFVTWENQLHNLDPDKQNPSVSFNLVGTDSLFVNFEEQFVPPEVPDDCKIIVPTAFSPNGDGRNDNFSLVADDCPVENYEMQIFNRWGENIFRSTELEQTWDGTYDNQLLDNGVYPYYINYSVIENGELVAKTARGAISIIR